MFDLLLNADTPSMWLSIIIFLPLVGALFVALHKPEREREAKAAGIFFSLITAAVSLTLYFGYDSGAEGADVYQFAENHEWISLFNVKYALAVDGITMLLVVLTTMLTPIVLAASALSVKKRAREYVIAMLVLETGMIGAFCAMDLFLFYVFFEVMLVPMYLLIGVWGGPNRIMASVKFFIYTLVGSLIMFFAILYCYHEVAAIRPEGGTFNIVELAHYLPQVWENNPTGGTLCFLAFMLSFMVKTPVFPFHTWLPDAHTEAPTGGSVILAGVMLKLGTYGMLRFGIGFFPAQAVQLAPLLVSLGVIGIVYGALMALAQDDLKKLVAYSSVSHLGFVVLGLFAFQHDAGVGAVLQMLNHGIATPLLFLCVGAIYDRRHTRMIDDFGGLAKVMPKFAVVFMIATLASIGLPGLNGFVGEFLILAGSFGSIQEVGMGWNWMRTAVAIAGTGVILGAVYMLWAYQRVIFGPLKREENRRLKDLSTAEMSYLVPVIVACFAIGIAPNFVIDPMRESIEHAYAPSKAIWDAEYNSAAPTAELPSADDFVAAK